MYRIDESHAPDQQDANRQTASLGGLAIALLLLTAGLALVQQLHAKSALEDCLLSGRSNCLPVAATRP